MRNTLKAAAVSGIAGPILLSGVIAVLTIVEHDFMVTLGWDPLTAPTRDWPSGLALGPWGFVMTAAFIVCGLMLVLFAAGMSTAFRWERGGPTASVLLAFAGLAMCILAFPTDPTNRALPLTWHGFIHDAAFVVLGVVLFASLAAFGFVFLAKGKWRANAVLSWSTAALIVPAFTLKGVAFYLFLVAVLLWCEAAALRALRRF